MKGTKGGAVVRALSSHQCGLARVRTYAICELSLLLVLSPGCPVFSSSSIWERTDTFRPKCAVSQQITNCFYLWRSNQREKTKKKYLNKYIVFVLFLCLLFDRLGVLLFCTSYRKIPKINPGAYIFQRPFLRGIFLEGLIYGGKFAFQNRLE